MKTTPISDDAAKQVSVWLQQAGEIALRHFANAAVFSKPDQTLVTQADLEIEHFLLQRLEQAFPDFGLISEEGGRGSKTGHCRASWVIDPLDGTTAFTQRLPGWGISVGLLQKGQPILGFYYMPLLNDLTMTTPKGKVLWNGLPLRFKLQRKWQNKGFLAINAAAHTDYDIAIRHTRALGSIGTNLIYTARGSAVATFIPQAHIWDLVAAGAILRCMGGEMRYLDGSAVDFEALIYGHLTPQPLVAGHPSLLQELASKIKLRAD